MSNLSSVAPFVAPRWFASTHLQTLGAALPLWAPPRSFSPAAVEALRIPLPAAAGATVPVAGALHALAWWQPGPAPRPTAIVVHGVGGSNESRYVVRAAVALHRAGWHVVRLNLRGAGGSIPDAPQLYHAGLTEDLRAAVTHLSGDVHVRGLALVGFSLGGHVVLRLAGELGQERDDEAMRRLRAVAAISAPLELDPVARAMERLRSLPYHFYVLRKLLRQADAFAIAHPDRAHYERGALRKLRTIRAFDGHVIAPMHGFESAEDYYARMSAARLLERVRLPALIVHAEDDPVVPADSLRASLRRAPEAVETAWTERGGHVGWFGGLGESSWVNTWAIDRTLSFLSARV